MDKVLDQVDALYEKAEISCEFCGEQIRDSYYQDHIKTQKHTKNEKRMKMLKLLEKGGQGTNPPLPAPSIIELPASPIWDDDEEEQMVLDQTHDQVFNAPDFEQPMNIEPPLVEEADVNLHHDFDALWETAFPTPPQNNPEELP